MKKFIALAMVIVMALAVAVPAFADPVVDVPDTHWAAEAVERLTGLGIITGYTDGTFRGQQNITRYEVAVMIGRLLDYLEGLMDQNQEAVVDIIDSRIMNIVTPAAGENVSWLERVIIQNISEMDEAKWNAIQNELDTLSGKVNELEAKGIAYDSLVEIIENISNSPAGSDASLKGEIARLEGMIEDLKEAQEIMAELQKEINALRSDLTRLSGNLATNNDFLTLSGRISYIETKLAALDDLGASNPDLTNEVVRLSDTVKDLQAAVNNLEKNNPGTYTANDILVLSGKISALEQQLANQPTAATELAALSSRLKSLEDQVAAMPQQSAITSLKNDFLALSGRVSYLEGVYAAQGNSNSTMIAEIEAMKAKLDDLAQINQTGSTGTISPALVNDLTVLNNKIIELEKKVNGIQSSLNNDNAVTENVAALQAEISGLKTAVAILSDVEYSSEIVEIQKELDTIKNQMGSSAASAEIANDLTVLNSKIIELDKKVNDKLSALGYTDNALANDVAALQAEISGLKTVADIIPDVEYSSAIAEMQKELDTIKNQMGSSAASVEIANDLTVLNSKIIELDKKVNDKLSALGYTDNALTNDVIALQAEINGLKTAAAAIPDVDYSLAIAEMQKELDIIKNQMGSSAASVEIANDLTVLNSKIIELDKKINDKTSALGYKDNVLTNDVAAIQSEIDMLNAYIKGILVANPDIEIDSTLYNMLLTMSGRISYLEGKMATVLETESIVSANLKTINDQLLTLSGRISYIESKFANFSPSEAAVYSNELAAIKSELNTIAGGTSSAHNAELVNDITVLNNKIINLDKKIDSKLSTSSCNEEALLAMINALEDRIVNVTVQVDELGLNKTFANDIQDIQNKIASIEANLNLVSPSLTNDITVLNDKVLSLENKITSANNKITETGYANSNIKNDVAAINQELSEINSYIASLVVEDGTIYLDSKAYDYFLTLSGRISYLEGKIANLTTVDPKITAEVATLSANIDGIVTTLESNSYGKDLTIYNDIFVLSTRVLELEDKVYQLSVADKALASEVADLNTRVKALEIQLTMADASLNQKIEAMNEAVKAQTANGNVYYHNDIELLNDITVLSDKMLQLENAVHSVGATNVVSMEKQISGLNSNDEALRLEIVQLKNNIASLQKTIEAQENISAASIPVDQLNDIYVKIASLESQMTSEIADVETEMAKLLEIIDEKALTTTQTSSVENIGNPVINLTVGGGNDSFIYDRIISIETNVTRLEQLLNDLRNEMIAGDQVLAESINEWMILLADFMFDTTEKLNLKSDSAEVKAIADRLDQLENVDIETINVELAELRALIDEMVAGGIKDIYVMNDITVLADRIGKLEDKVYYISSTDFETLRNDFAALQVTVANADKQTQAKFADVEELAMVIDERLAELEDSASEHMYFVNDITVLADKIQKLEQQLANLVQLENTVAELGESLAFLGTEFRQELDALDERVTALEIGQNGLTQKLGTVSDLAKSNETRIDALEQEVALLSSFANKIKISGTNTLDFTHRGVNNFYDNPAGEFYRAPFEFTSSSTYGRTSAISNTTAFTLSLRPDSGVKVDLNFELKLKDMFTFAGSNLNNKLVLSDSSVKVSIEGDKVVASLYGGDIRNNLPTSFTNYTLNTGVFASNVLTVYEDYDLGLRKYTSVSGITGDVTFLNNTLTISTLFAKIIDGDNSDDINHYKYLYGAAAVFAPNENINVGIRAAGDFYNENIDMTDGSGNPYEDEELSTTTYGADFSVRFLEKLTASGEFAYSMNDEVQGSAMKFNVTAGLEPGLVVTGDFERIDPDYRPNYVLVTEIADDHNIKGQITTNIMNMGLTVKLPKVIGFTLSGKLEFNGDYVWGDDKYRIETITLTYEPSLSTSNYLKLTAEAARINDLTEVVGPIFKALGKIEYERAFMTFDATYTGRFDIDNAWANESHKVESNVQFNIVKDVVTLKGGLLLNMTPESLHNDDLFDLFDYQKYTAEALVALKLGEVVTVDLSANLYFSKHLTPSEVTTKDYLGVKAAADIAWNMTNTTKLTVGASTEYRKYQLAENDHLPHKVIGVDPDDVNYYVRNGLYTAVTVGLEQKVFTSTTIGLNYTYKFYNLESAVMPERNNDTTYKNQNYKATMNQITFNVKTVF